MKPKISVKLRSWMNTRSILAGTLVGIFLVSGCTNASLSPSPAASNAGNSPAASASSSTKSPAASPAKSPSAGSLKACDLLTNSEIEAVLGGSWQGPTTGSTDLECTWTQVEPIQVLAITLQKGDSTAFEGIKAVLGSTQDVPGIGDKAVWGSSIGQFWVLKGDYLFDVTISLNTDQAALDNCKTLAKKIADRLP